MADQPNALPDVDPQETKEWIDALEGVIAQEGAERANYLIDKFDVAKRRDLSSAKDETWDGLEALGQHFRSQGMLIRFGTNHEAEQRHRENGCRIVRKLLAAGADLTATTSVGPCRPQPANSSLTRSAAKIESTTNRVSPTMGASSPRVLS